MKFNSEDRWNVVRRTVRQAARGAVTVGLAGALAIGMAGCSGATSGNSVTASQTISASTGAAEGVTTSAAEYETDIDESLYDLEYTNRDQDPSYDAASATSVKLDGTTAEISGDGAVADGNNVTITSEGVYVLSGTLSDGQVIVDALEDAKVQLVFDGVDITSSTGPAVLVNTADKCFITLVDGTTNKVTDAATYADDLADSNATIYSYCDLTLQGGGSLEVNANYNDGIKTKDDLVVTGGTYVVNAVSDGLVGHDSVKIQDGTFTITAGKDGVKSSKDDDESKGFVSLDGGTFTINAQEKGVKAQTYLRVADGVTAHVESGDDAFHSNGDARIAGGDLTIDAGDDAIHSEYILQVDTGTITITNCYEGLESQAIVLNDATTYITASDDGINAATADASSDDETTVDGSTAQEPADGRGSDEQLGNQMSEGDSGTGMQQLDGNMPDGAAPFDREMPEGMEPPEGGMPGGQGGPGGGQMPGREGQQGGFGGGQRMDGGNSEQGFDGQRPNMGNESDGNSMGGGFGDQRPDAGDEELGGAGDGAMNNRFGGGDPMMDSDENCTITINGGLTVVEAGGDGIDSNGYIYLNGGVVLVSGPTSSGDGSLDYGLGAEANGGTLLAAGSSGMAESFTGGTQGFALVNASGNAGDEVAVTDADGNVLAWFKPTKNFQCVIVSTDGMRDGQEYNLIVGGTANVDEDTVYATAGSASGIKVEGGTTTSFTASTEAQSSGMGGMGGMSGPGGQMLQGPQGGSAA